MPAPVAMFVYKRADHAQKTLAALAANDGAAETDLIVFCDGARGANDAQAVMQTRRVVQGAGGFKSLSIRERPENLGLAQNIVQGVGEILDAHGRVIVLEDDLITAPGFLTYMNLALDRYRDEPDAWHISGWNYPMDPNDIADAFFWSVMNCWGWATWADRWQHLKLDPKGFVDAFSTHQIRDFNLGDRVDFWNQMERNAAGDLSSWAIFWYATVFKNQGLCLNPSQSLVSNIGLDGSGENSGRQAGDISELPEQRSFALPAEVRIDNAAVARVVTAIAASHRRPHSYRWRLRRRRWKKYGLFG